MKLSKILIVLLCFYSALLWAEEKKTIEQIYQKRCASCHHMDRLGKLAPPLLPEFLKKIPDTLLESKIKKGVPASQMPAFADLSDTTVKDLVKYLKSAKQVNWRLTQVKKSYQKSKKKKNPILIQDEQQLTTVVERDANQVWIMEGAKLLDKFTFTNIHGGIKYSTDARHFYIPARDGWVGHFDMDQGQLAQKIRPCIYLRNLALDRSSSRVFVSCWLPKQIVILDAQNLNHIKTIPVSGKITAIYERHDQDELIYSFNDRPELLFLNSKTLKQKVIPLQEPFEDFFIDPSEKFIVASSRRGKYLNVWDIEKKQIVFRSEIEGMPHLASAAFWYDQGKYYFATPHIGRGKLSIWQMYDWKLQASVSTHGDGFFVRTHPQTDYLWADNGSDQLVLIHKKSYQIKKILPFPSKKFMHTEFSGDGKIAYLSIYDHDGALILYDTGSLLEIKRYPAQLPVGKYNTIKKNLKMERALIGQEVLKNKCASCHQLPQLKSFDFPDIPPHGNLRLSNYDQVYLKEAIEEFNK